MAENVRIILLLLIVPLFLFSQSENYRSEILTVEQGLSNNTITCLLQDQQGFIWIGTEDGLMRYDGYTFREYHHDPDDFKSLSHNHIRAIYQDPADSGKVVWIGTKVGGLNKFNLETQQFKRYLHDSEDPSSISDNDVKCIFKDTEGVYWIGTRVGGLNQFDRENGKFISYRRDPHDPFSLSNNNVAAINEDLLGNLWIATAGGGLNKLLLPGQETDSSSSVSTTAETWTTHPVSELWENNLHNSSSGEWKKKNNMLTAKWGSSACIINDKLYVVGGIGYNRPPDTPCLPILEVYHPSEDRWERLVDMNVSRAGLSTSVFNGKIYAIGGFATHYTMGSSGQVVEEYNPHTDIWFRKKDMPERSGDHQAVVLGDKIYLIGGCNSDEFLSPAVKTVRVYDPKTDGWSKRADMNVARTVFAACVLGRKIYVIGGMKAPGSMAGLKSVEVYDPIRNSWKDLKEMPRARWGLSAAVVNGKIRVYGGVEKRDMQNSVFEYDAQLDEWQILPNMPIKRAVMSSSQLNGKIYFIGGIGYPERSIHSKSDSSQSVKFIRYRLDPFDYQSLPSNYVYSIFKDRQGTSWIGTEDGLCKFDGDSNQFIRHRFSGSHLAVLNTTRIGSIHEDSRGSLWISTQNAGLFQIHENRNHVAKIQYNSNGISASTLSQVSAFIQDRSGIIWLGTKGSGIKKLIPERKRIQHFKNLHGNGKSGGITRVSSIYSDSHSQLWLGTGDGVLHKLDDKFQKINRYYFDTNRPIEKICGTQNGKLWLARGNALTKFNPDTEKYSNFYGAWGPYFTAVPMILYRWIEDLGMRGQLIVSIEKVGNNQHKMRQFEIGKEMKVAIIAQGEAVLNELFDNAWLVEEKSNKNLWQMEAVKTRHAGGASRNRIQLDSLTLMPGKYRLEYHSNEEHAFDTWIEQAPPRPALWGISVFSWPKNPERKVLPLFTQNNFTSNINDIYGLKELWLDRSDKLWCLINGRLYHFDESSRQFIHHEISINDQSITDNRLIYQDRAGIWWFGTSGNGLIKKSNSDFDIYHSQLEKYEQFKSDLNDLYSLNGNTIYSICEDQNGFLWIGTERGLNKFDVKKEDFKHYTEKNELKTNLISGILNDDQGNLWISTAKGLTRFDPNLEQFFNFDERDQQPFLGFNDCHYKGQDGKIYFGGDNGFVVFYPDSLRYNTHIPPVVITNLQLFNKSVQPGKSSPLQKSITHSREIKFNHTQDVFSFEFAALDFTNSSKNQYAHMMEGVDPDWVYTDATRRYVTYTRLEPGEYIFRVKASNNDGIWNEAETSLKIIIAPPWWATRWAYFIYVILFGSLAYGVWRFQTNRLKMQHQLELEQVHAAKLEELDHMKSRFFANISHEFRTPLTLILGPLEQMISGKLKKNVHNQYKIMRRNANRLLQLINQLLDLSKLEDGKLKIQAQKIEIIALMSGLVQAFESLAVLKHIALKFDPEADAIELYVDRDKFETIINNLLSNAFKFTPEGGEVIVNIPLYPPSKGDVMESPLEGGARRAGGVYILISNTGPGIAAEHIDKVFDRFYQADDWEQEGTGIGLTLTKELIELHHGKIQVESIPGIKTTFSIFLPLGKEHLEPDQILESKRVRMPRERTKILPVLEDETTNVNGKLTEASNITEKLPLILVVEDNIDLRRYLVDILKKDAKIKEAIHGEDGFKKSTELVPDLIISDVMMPKMDGFELCKKLKTDERTSHIPVILMTARAAKEDKLEGLETGADDYIAKPFEADELLVRVLNLIEQRRMLRKRFSTSKGLKPEDIAVTSADERFLKKALAIIEKHLSQPEFGVAGFSQEMALSRVQLHRKLQAITDQSTSEFIRSIRLNRAAHLLGKNMDNISQIAYEVGFSNPAHFATSFRKQFGLSPKEYMKSNSSKNQGRS